MPACPIQGKSQVMHGKMVHTMQKGNCWASGLIIRNQQVVRVCSKRLDLRLIRFLWQSISLLDDYKTRGQVASMNFICIIYFKESQQLMEDQKSKMTPPQGEQTATDTIPSFLLKTYEILENDKYSDIICWTKNGEGFIVKKVKEFSENILPIYFRHSNYTSFVRQLNMYDFHKTRQENHENAFKNLMFKKGYKYHLHLRRHMLRDIQRKDYKKNKDCSKQGTTNQRGTLERTHILNKSQSKYQVGKDSGKVNLKQLIETNFLLEKKSLALAELKEIPKKGLEFIRLLDVLFDAKKTHKDLVDKMKKLNLEPEEHNLSFNSLKQEKTAQKLRSTLEYPTTDSKEFRLIMPKDIHQIGTNVSLFSSFNQI